MERIRGLGWAGQLQKNIFLPTHCWCTGLLLHLITLTDTHSVGLCTRDRPVSEVTACTIHSIDKRHDIHAPCEVQSRKPSACLRLRPRGHWDRPNWTYCVETNCWLRRPAINDLCTDCYLIRNRLRKFLQQLMLTTASYAHLLRL